MQNLQKILSTLGAATLTIAGIWLMNNKPARALSEKTDSPVTITQAIETATTANPGTKVIGASLEQENNKLVWEVELENDLEVYVDANTRKILKTEGGWNLADLQFLID